MAFSSSFTHCVCWATVGRRVRILAHVGGLPASAPGTVASTTRPVYPPGVFPVRLRRCRWLAVPRGSANDKKRPPGGEGLSHTPADGGGGGGGVITLRKERCCLRSSTVGGRGPFCPPVTSGSQKTGFANRAVSTSGPPALLDDAQVQRPRRCDRGKLPGRIQSLPPFSGKVRTRGLPAKCQRLRARPQRWVLARVAEIPEVIANSILIQVHVPVLVYARVARWRLQLAATVSIGEASKAPAPLSRGPWRGPGLSHPFIPGSPRAAWPGHPHSSPSRRRSHCFSPRRCGTSRR